MNRCWVCGEPGDFDLRLQGREAGRATRVWWFCNAHGRRMTGQIETAITDMKRRDDAFADRMRASRREGTP